MRTRLFALFLAIWPVSTYAQKAPPPSLTSHVRWIVDLKKKYGYESFERVKDVIK